MPQYGDRPFLKCLLLNLKLILSYILSAEFQQHAWRIWQRTCSIYRVALSGKESMSMVFLGEGSRYVTLWLGEQNHGATWRGELKRVVCSGKPG